MIPPFLSGCRSNVSSSPRCHSRQRLELASRCNSEHVGSAGRGQCQSAGRLGVYFFPHSSHNLFRYTNNNKEGNAVIIEKLMPIVATRINASFKVQFVCFGAFRSRKCQPSSFHLALCLLPFNQRTVCLAN